MREKVARFEMQVGIDGWSDSESPTQTTPGRSGKLFLGIPRRESRWLMVVLAVGALLRLVFLQQPMRYDEAFSFLYFVSQPLSVGLSDYSLPNNHLFHSLLAHVAYLLLGPQPWVLRLPAFGAGIALIAATYFAARQFYGRHAAILAASVVASSSILIEYSTNARGYMLLCLIFISLVAFGGGLVHSEKWAEWLLFGVISAIGFYTVPIMLYGYGAVVTWLALSITCDPKHRSKKRALALLVLSFGATLLVTVTLYAPVFLNTGLDSIIRNRFVAPVGRAEFFARFLPSLAEPWQQWTRDVPAVMIGLLAVGFVVAHLFHSRLTGHRVPVTAAILLWLTISLLLYPVVPHGRVWLFLLPWCAVVCAAGINHIFGLVSSGPRVHGRLVACLSVSMLVAPGIGAFMSQSIVYSEETGTLRDAEAIALFLKLNLRGGDKVVAALPSDAPLAYYFHFHAIPLGYLTAQPSAANRLWVVVNLAQRQTFRDVVEKRRIPSIQLSAPKKRRIYESAILYEAQPIKPGG